MKLFCAPGFSSLADHIAMLEAGLQFDIVKVDIETKQMEGGGLYTDVNPKGYVPALMLDDGELLTENVAILTWVADSRPSLAPPGPLGPLPAHRNAELHCHRDPQALSTSIFRQPMRRKRPCERTSYGGSALLPVASSAAICLATPSARRMPTYS